MNKNTQYLYSLLDDDDFIQWIIHPSELSDKYWNEIMKNDKEKEEQILHLGKLIKSIRVRESGLSPENKSQIWEKIQMETSFRRQRLVRRRWFTAASVAASLLLLISSYYFFEWTKGNDSVDYLSIVSQQTDTVNQDKVRLVLSEDKTLNIEQENVELVYDKNGKVNIDQESSAESNDDNSKPQLNQLIVPYGKSSSVVLSDGTKIWVNAGSRLIYPTVFSENKREIFVEGEIYLEVARNEHLPFVVKTDVLEVEVLGTSFNVQAYKGETNQSIVLVTGSVSVRNSARKDAAKLIPNQMYSYEGKSQKSTIQKVDIYDHICWKYGFLHFESEKLGTVLDRLGRYYDLGIEYDVDQTKNILVSGKLDLKENVADVFKSIALTAPFDFEIANKNVKIKVKPKNKRFMMEE